MTDGLIRWNDPVSYFMRGLDGVEIGGLLRFFDTNFYFRQPQIVGELSFREPCFKTDLLFLKGETDAAIKLVLTGPYTLALLSRIATPRYRSTEQVAEALTDILMEELKSIQDIGIPYVQLEEPGYLLAPPNWNWASSLVKRLSSSFSHSRDGGNPKWILSTYFGDAAPYYSQLQNFSVDLLSFDVTYSPRILERIRKEGCGCGIQLGLLDGRNTKLEDPNKGVDVLRSLAERLDRLVLTTSCGLEYLSRDRALDKLRLLEDMKDAYNGKKTIKKE